MWFPALIQTPRIFGKQWKALKVLTHLSLCSLILMTIFLRTRLTSVMLLTDILLLLVLPWFCPVQFKPCSHKFLVEVFSHNCFKNCLRIRPFISNLSIWSVIIPSIWKILSIVPLQKGGDTCLAKVILNKPLIEFLTISSSSNPSISLGFTAPLWTWTYL